MITWLLRVLPFLGKIRLSPQGWLIVVLIGALVAQGAWGRVQTGRLERRLEAVATEREELKRQIAQQNANIVQLTEAVKNLKVGERATGEIPKPQYIPYAVPGPLKVEYIRVPGAIQTRVETIRLPGKDIEKIIDTAPQTIIAEFTATRDIKAGEKFRLIAAQVSPGIYQPILDLGAPVTVEVRVATPIDKIPAPIPTPSRLTFTAYSGYAFGVSPSWLTGIRADYRLSQRWGLEADAAYFWSTRTQQYRLLATLTF